MRGVVLMVAVGLLGVACALPAYEVDPSFGTGGAGGSGAGSSGTAGTSNAGTSSSGTGGGGGEVDRESACIEYCGIYVNACLGHEANTYDDASACVSVCATANWPFDPGSDPDVIMAGGSLQCRLQHAKFARDMGREPHCYHASEFPSMGACE